MGTPKNENRTEVSRGTSDIRRNQVRQAQKVYHARKKEAFQNLESRVRYLEQTIEEMSNVVLGLNDTLVSTPTFRQEPWLVQQLQATLSRIVELASSVQSDEDDKPREIKATSITSSSPGAEKSSKTSSAEVDAQISYTLAAGQLSSGMQQPSQNMDNLPLLRSVVPETDNERIILHHPVAAQIFPFFHEWSDFASRLYWTTLVVAYNAMSGANISPLGQMAFRYTLRYSQRDKILNSLRNMLDYVAVTPLRPDGTVVVTKRPIDYSNSRQTCGANESRETLHAFLERCALVADLMWTSLDIQDRNQRFFSAKEIEPYVRSKGFLFQFDSMVELPVRSSIYHPKSARGNELQKSTEAWTYAIDNSSDSTSFDPLSWHDSRVIFPTEQSVHSDPLTIDNVMHGDPQSVTQFPEEHRSKSQFISMDELIEQLSAISLCMGTGARYPAHEIDTALEQITARALVC